MMIKLQRWEIQQLDGAIVEGLLLDNIKDKKGISF